MTKKDRNRTNGDELEDDDAAATGTAAGKYVSFTSDSLRAALESNVMFIPQKRFRTSVAVAVQ